MTSQNKDQKRKDKALCFSMFNNPFSCLLQKRPYIFVLHMLLCHQSCFLSPHLTVSKLPHLIKTSLFIPCSQLEIQTKKTLFPRNFKMKALLEVCKSSGNCQLIYHLPYRPYQCQTCCIFHFLTSCLEGYLAEEPWGTRCFSRTSRGIIVKNVF